MKSLKSAILIFTFFLSQKNIRAQEKFSDTALYKISYTFIYAYDTTDLNKKSVDTVNLFIGKSHSVYRYAGYEALALDRKRLRAEILEQYRTKNLSKPITTNGNVKRVSQTEIFRNLMGNTLYKKEVLVVKDYLMEDNLPLIQWQIEPETKLFDNITGQKAAGVFRGRTYTAWFAAKLPYRVGPWKLGGLPGVILEVSDDKKEVVFLFAGLKTLENQPPTVIAIPEKAIKIKQLEFQKLGDLAMQDPVAFAINQNAQSGITVTVGGKSLETLSNTNPKPKPTKSRVNNPIEIADK